MKVRVTFEYDTGLLADDPKGIVRQQVFDDIQQAAVMHHLGKAMLFLTAKDKDALTQLAVDHANRKADLIRDGIITNVDIIPPEEKDADNEN
jgi:hypothetical protein